MNQCTTSSPRATREILSKLSPEQFKIFFGIIVHCRAHGKGFISKRSFFNLWCELNYYCHELDESFPDQYNDIEEMRSFCHRYPYYFIDRLPINLIANLFSEYCDERLDVLENLVQILYNQGSRAAHQYVLDEFKFDHNADELLSDLEEHIARFS